MSDASSLRFAFPSAAGSAAPAAPPNPMVMERMAAGAFRSLCDHLRLRSDDVQNMDLMTVGGFCRNCLAKWMVIEARRLRDDCLKDGDVAVAFSGNKFPESHERKKQLISDTIEALGSFGYDEAAKEVYGVTYPEWQKRHQRNATEEQLRLYKESTPLHATHDPETQKKVASSTMSGKHPSRRALVRLQAGAFLSLCRHLRERSDEIQNMELMTIGGFCRNCLAKWLVVEARKISDDISADDGVASLFPAQQQDTVREIIISLDLFGYDEAAQYVYGCTYPEWKKRHQKKATDEQMERYNWSKHLHARHDKELLATRSSADNASSDRTAPSGGTEPVPICIKEPTQRNPLLSDVCCQDLDTVALPVAGAMQSINVSRQIAKPPKGELRLKVGILTVSDRAAANEYKSGDLSGPAVEGAVTGLIGRMNASFADQNIAVAHLEKKIVADEIPDIKEALLRWSGKTADATDPLGLIFTTGGTGFARRDVTPEATLSVLDRECQSLMSWASAELKGEQPLATLSRAAGGVCGKTLIVNLPGNPSGAARVVDVLFPLLLHAIKDLNGGR